MTKTQGDFYEWALCGTAASASEHMHRWEPNGEEQ